MERKAKCCVAIKTCLAFCYIKKFTIKYKAKINKTFLIAAENKYVSYQTLSCPSPIIPKIQETASINDVVYPFPTLSYVSVGLGALF